MLGARFGWLLAASFVLLPGCFSEPQNELPPGCSLGQHLCPCSDGDCDPGLTCSVSADVCVSLDCEVGALECPCGMEGACNPGLVCGEYKYCVPADGTASTAGTDDPSGTMSASMSAGVTSESDSDSVSATMSTTTPVDPDTGVTETTDDSESDSNPTASSTRGESSSSGDDPSMTTAMTDSDSDSSSTSTGIDPSISSTAVVTDSDSDSLGTETTDMTSSSSASSASSSSTNGETGEFPDCQACVEDAQSGACSTEWDACEAGAQMGMPTCDMQITSYITCMQGSGGSDDICPCVGINDPLFTAFQMCLSATCANECNCY